MTKIFLLPSMLVVALSFASCGDSGTATGDSATDSTPVEVAKPKFGDVCKDASKIAITIKDYKYGMSGAYEYMTDNFVVKDASFHITNDSTATMTLKNYAAADLVGDRKDDQVDIICEFGTKGGKPLAGTTFMYMDYEGGASVMCTMITSKGTVYFNWVASMPDQGGVTLNFAEEGKACGTFQLAVEKADNEQIGTVRLNGTFKVGE